MIVARCFVDELFVVERQQRAAAFRLIEIVTSDSRSGVECHAQLNTSRAFGTTSR